MVVGLRPSLVRQDGVRTSLLQATAPSRRNRGPAAHAAAPRRHV